MSPEPPPNPPDPALAEERPVEPMFRVPPATGWLIAINLAVQIARMFLSPAQDDIVVDLLGFDPASLQGPLDPRTLLTLVTYQFLHGGWDHIAINMVSLLAFGPGIERPMGRARFVILYLVSGVAGALLEAAVAQHGAHDVILGASASISGVFGALIVIWGIYRRGKRPLGIVPMALLWIVLLAVTGILGVGAQGSPVAWVAHIGGFVAGMLLVRPLATGLARR